VPDQLVFLILGGMAFSLAWGVLSTIKSLLLKRMEAKGTGDVAALSGQVAELERRLNALGEGVVDRLQDVEERLDFTERVLAVRNQERLPGGPSN
jgi:hypothetical protein